MKPPWEYTNHRPRSISWVELEGERLSRTAYLDESGISAKEPICVVAGVIVDLDRQWKVLEQYISALADVYVPDQHRQNFVFHATELYHGSGPVFDRRMYPRERSYEALKKLVQLPLLAGLPVVWGFVKKSDLQRDSSEIRNPRRTNATNQGLAFALCVIGVEHYMRDHAEPSELATIVAEKNTDAIKSVKVAHVSLKGRYEDCGGLLNLCPEYVPVKRVIDSVQFAEKDESILLQIADVCAFIVRYSLQNKPNCDELFALFTKYNANRLQPVGPDEIAGYKMMWPSASKPPLA